MTVLRMPMFSCFHEPPKAVMDYGIFNVLILMFCVRIHTKGVQALASLHICWPGKLEKSLPLFTHQARCPRRFKPGPSKTSSKEVKCLHHSVTGARQFSLHTQYLIPFLIPVSAPGLSPSSGLFITLSNLNFTYKTPSVCLIIKSLTINW